MKRILLLASAVAFLPMMALAVSFNHNLSPGTSGADVIHLQQFLVSEGMYSGPITGMFGPLTKKALIAFQEKEGISPTGYFGPLTQAAANAAISSLSLPPVSLYSTSPILVVSEPTSLSATSSYAQKFIDGTSLDTAIDSYGYIDVSFDTVLTYEQWIESFHWTIPNQFIFGGDPSLPQIKTSFQCIPGPTHDIQALGFGGLVFPANGNYQCQMIITDINGNVARREFDFSSSGPSPSSSRPIATSSAPSAPPVSNAVAPASIPISTQSIVGLRCYYTTPDPNILALLGTSTFSSQLTGVVVNPDGYILTAKHGVDPQWVSQIVLASSSAQVIFSQSVFKYCDVGVPPESYSLPTWQQIQALNPGEPLGPMRYTASLYFDPSSSTMSEQEYHETDFAILKINGVANGCSTWYPDCTLPSQFPYSPVFSAVPPVRSQLLTYGYPVEAESDYQNQFYLKGAFGHVSSFDYGDTYFSTTALALHWSADDIMGGRSGSPLYWNGYVVGVLSNRNVDEATSTAVAMPAIEKVLQNNGLGNLLMTK